MNPNTQTLPAHAALISAPDVWMEGDAIAQLADVASLPGCVRAAGMPDLHPGRGFPIGAVVATRDVVYPHLVGGDAGCGARVIFTRVRRADADRLERRVREAWRSGASFGALDAGDTNHVDTDALFQMAWSHGPRGLCLVEGLPDSLRAMCAREPVTDGLPPSGDPSRLLPLSGTGAVFARSLGSIGGGNHFAEVTRVSKIWNAERADMLGCERDTFAVLVHSGSRGLGTALGTLFHERPLTGADADDYLSLLAGACRFARANRIILIHRLAGALGATRESMIAGGFDVTHNDVRITEVLGARAFVHRKGAAPALEGDATVVLGSRGTPSFVLSGAGSEASLFSVAHGAGRRMRRGEAREKLRERYRRKELSRASGSGRVVCDDKDLLYEEHPDAYKSISPIISALESHGAAYRVAELLPFLTVKL